jgi:hypothetical protein
MYMYKFKGADDVKKELLDLKKKGIYTFIYISKNVYLHSCLFTCKNVYVCGHLFICKFNIWLIHLIMLVL